jgi:beta-lactamase class A
LHLISGDVLTTLAAEAELVDPSIVVEALGPAGESRWHASVDPERPLYPASMIKLPIALALAALCEAGAYRLDDTVAVDPANLTVNDAPSPFVAGYRASLGELARAMLAKSDNVATNVLIDVLERETLERACLALGLTRTAIRRKLSGALPLIADPAARGRNAHPAADAAAALRLLASEPWRRTGAWVHDALLAQIWNDKLPRGWRPGDTFAHKTGDTDEVSHDGGILTLGDGRRFIVVVYTGLSSSPLADARLAAFASRLRPLLEIDDPPATAPASP